MQIVAKLIRGDHVESVHRGAVFVVDAFSRLCWQTRNCSSEAKTYFRSAAKPIQFLASLEYLNYLGVSMMQEELAVAVSSHNSEPVHLSWVERLLSRAGVTEEALRCGPTTPLSRDVFRRLLSSNNSPRPMHNCCSGKHAAMLLGCSCAGYRMDTYLDPAHPLQREIGHFLSDFCNVPANLMTWATDDCGAPTPWLSMRAMATAYARLADLKYWRDSREGEYATLVKQVRDAMMDQPFLIAGSGRMDTRLMEASEGEIFSKTGAEGIWCLGFPHRGLGMVIKIEDGSDRVQPLVLVECLKQTGLVAERIIKKIDSAFDWEVRDTNQAVIGRFEADIQLDVVGRAWNDVARA